MPAAIPIAIMAAAGAQTAGTIYASKSAGKAAKQQGVATDQALALQRQQYENTRANLAPYMASGYGALTKLADRAGVNFLGPQGPIAPSAVANGSVPLASFVPPNFQPQAVPRTVQRDPNRVAAGLN